MDLKGKYGLIIPAKEREAKAAAAAANPPPSNRKRNVFGEDSDSEPDEDTDWVKKTMKKQTHGSIQQRQSAQAIKQALEDDPTVYQYDELYDGMEEKRVNSKESQKKDRKAKYIENLLKTAEKRKHEEEARNERLVQKEREKEGDMFKDKEAFVTGAYRKKMEELEKIKEEESRRDQLDALVDVTKQKDLSGFYRHLYRQQLDEPGKKGQEGAENLPKQVDAGTSKEVSVKQEPNSPSHHQKLDRTPERETALYVKEEIEKKSDRSHRSPKREHREERGRHEKKSDGRKRSRDRDYQDRGRDDRHKGNDGGSRSSSRRERDYKDRRSDRDRDQRHQGDEDRGRDNGRDHDRRRDRDRRDRSRSRDRKKDGDRDHGRRDRDQRNKRERTPEKKVKVEEKPDEEVIKTEVKVEEIENTEVKPSIWAKRTVREVFDVALARYFSRKQANTLQASVVPNHD